MNKYLTARELWLMAVAWNEATYRTTTVIKPKMKDWLNADAEDGLTVRQALAKTAPEED